MYTNQNYQAKAIDINCWWHEVQLLTLIGTRRLALRLSLKTQLWEIKGELPQRTANVEAYGSAIIH